MATDLTSSATTPEQTPAAAPQPPQLVLNEQLHCALTGKPITAEEAYWAPPLVTARDLVTTVLRTAIQTPGNLGHILFEEQPNVPYAPDARDLLARRRSSEQLKLLLILLCVVAVVAAPILWVSLS